MTRLAFGAQTPRDLLSRTSHEINELGAATKLLFLVEEEGKQRVGSLAATCAGSLWNLVDWLANSRDSGVKSALAKAGMTTKKAIRDHVKANSRELMLCWELTNGYKHCELTGYLLTASEIDEASLSAPSALSPDTRIAYRFVPKITTKDGAKLFAVQVYKDAFAYWDRLFKHLNL